MGNGELLSEEAREERFKWVNLPPNIPQQHYAFGIGFTNGWWGHSGTIPGYNTLILYRPDIEASLVVLVNTDKDLIVDGKEIAPVYVLANKILAIAAREAPLGEIPDEVPWEDDSFDE